MGMMVLVVVVHTSRKGLYEKSVNTEKAPRPGPGTEQKFK